MARIFHQIRRGLGTIDQTQVPSFTGGITLAVGDVFATGNLDVIAGAG